MCPNLQQLNLEYNSNCLKSLQGLRVIANCNKLQGLNLLGISVKDVENRVQLWEILVDLKLLYLAVEFVYFVTFMVKMTILSKDNWLISEVFKIESAGVVSWRSFTLHWLQQFCYWTGTGAIQLSTTQTLLNS